MEISLHLSISLSCSRFPSLLFPPKSKPQQQQNPSPPLLLRNPNPKISMGDLHRPSAIKRSGLLSAIDHAIEEEEVYRKARAEVNRKGIDARGYVIEGFSVCGHETCVVIPALNSVFDIGRCPSRAVHQDFLFTTHAHLDHIITTFNIYMVVRGTVFDSKYPPDGDVDPYAAPKSMGIFRMIESPRDTAAASVAKRIVANHDIYKKRNEKKGRE